MTPDMLDQITGHTRYKSRKVALCRMINEVSPRFGTLADPHELALFLSQVLHESAGLRYVKEVWGPTAAQRRYEGRKDLGNTVRGDGKLFMGRDIMQITGRSNYRHMTDWLNRVLKDAPDFEATPKELESPEYLGWGALWYWSTRIPQKYIDAGNIEMVTRRVNGGLNGYSDRLRYYDRAALVILGYGPDDVKEFQRAKDLVVDGISGPATRGAMHRCLSRMGAPVASPVPTPEEKSETGGLIALIVSIFAAIFGGKK